ncbi:MAG TPA: Hsp70 family protein [Ktedonobacteraceae bacterium]|nr:Hsp70 family protein [Ktedonobacteraceae bacterium]
MARHILSKAVGIDLGTTNSVAATMNPIDTALIVHTDRDTKRRTTPSCVWKNSKTGEIVVGRKAYSRIGNEPQPIRSIKRLMGSQRAVSLTDEQATPEEISAHILREMKQQIEVDVAEFATEHTEWAVDRAIITVPAYFDQPQIEATRKAAELAGLQVLELLHEPTAAACYHCWSTNTRNGVFLVYDLGGGTFDVSVLRCTEGEFEVLGINGNNRLGGDDIDALLAEELRKRLVQEGYDLELDYEDQEDKLRFEKLKLLAEGVKKNLSLSTECVLRDTTTLQDKSSERVDIDLNIERSDLEEIVRPVVARTIPYCIAALEQAKEKADVTLAEVDAIILAGGTTHIPLVREMVRKHLCANPAVSEPRAKCEEPVYNEVDTIVAFGAAIRAAATGGLIVYNPEKTIRVSFRGVSLTDSKQTHIGGTVEALTEGIDLSTGRIRLLVPAIGYTDEQEFKANGAFGFTRIPLQAASINLLAFEIYDRAGTKLATVERAISQSKDAGRPTGGSTGTAKLSKTLGLDVVRSDGTLQSRFSLVEALTTLPTKANFTFYYRGDNPVRLPFYQNSKKILEIQVELSHPPAIGTAIPMEIEINNLAHITVRGQIGQDPAFEASIRPVEQSVPTPEELQKIEREFHTATATLPSGKRAVAEAQYRRARQSYEHALKHADQDHATHEFEQMRELVTSLGTRQQNILQPPEEEFNELVRGCIALNDYARRNANRLDQPHDAVELVRTIEEHKKQGERAWRAGDQQTYSEAIQMLESIREYLHGLLYAVIAEEDHRSETEKLADFLEYWLQQVTVIEQRAIEQSRTDLSEQLLQIRQKLTEATLLIESNINQAWNIARRQYELIEEIKKQLNRSVQYTHDLKGLVEKRDR